MPEKQLHVELLAYTPEPEKTCALAARTCYSAMEYDELKALVNEKDQAAFLRRIAASGHLSVLIIRSAFMTEVILWAIINRVVSPWESRNPARIAVSVAVSTAEVESSRIMILGCFSRARAIHMRCF